MFISKKTVGSDEQDQCVAHWLGKQVWSVNHGNLVYMPCSAPGTDQSMLCSILTTV